MHIKRIALVAVTAAAVTAVAVPPAAVAESPASITAPTTADAKAELYGVLAATTAADSRGFSLIREHGDSYETVVVTGANLGTSNPTVATYFVDRPVYSGRSRNAELPDGAGGGIHYENFGDWRKGTSPRGTMLRTIDEAVAAAGGTAESYVPTYTLDSEFWPIWGESASDREPGRAVREALENWHWENVPVVKTVTDSGATYTLRNDHLTLKIFVDQAGLVTKMSNPVDVDFEVTARGDAVVVPDLEFVDTTIVIQAEDYLFDEGELRTKAYDAVYNAKKAALSKRGKAKGKVTMDILGKKLQREGLYGPRMDPVYSTERTTQSFIITVVDDSAYGESFGPVCKTYTPKGKRVVVRAC